VAGWRIIEVKVKGGDKKCLVALLDVLRKCYDVEYVKYEKPALSRDIEVEVEGKE
jgi:hypothetical protein